MKKTVIFFSLLIITTIYASNSLAYWSGWVESPQWPDGYQETKQYIAGNDIGINYHLYVDCGAAYIGHDGGLNDQLICSDGVQQKYAYFEGPWITVVMTACNLQHDYGYARVVAYFLSSVN